MKKIFGFFIFVFLMIFLISQGNSQQVGEIIIIEADQEELEQALEYLQNIQKQQLQAQTSSNSASQHDNFQNTTFLKSQYDQMQNQYRQNMNDIYRREFRDNYGRTYQQRGCVYSVSNQCRY